MQSPSQDQLALELEADWIRMFNTALDGATAGSGDLVRDDIAILIVEVETLFFLTPHEQDALIKAWDCFRGNRFRSALVHIHPLINARAARDHALANETSG